MRTVHMTVTVRGPVIELDVGRTLDPAAGKLHVHLHRPDAGPAHPANVDFDLWNSQAARETPEPAFRRTGGKQGAQKHVPADPGGGVEDGKPTL